MKKSTKSMILALTAFSSIAMSSCSVTKKDNFVIDFTYDTASGDKVTTTITADEVLERYIAQEGTTSAKAYYDAIYEVALRETFSNTNGKFHDKYSQAVSDANRAVDEAKDAADDADTSWEDYLKNNLGINQANLTKKEREHIYYLQCEVNAMKEIVNDEFYDTFNQWNPDKDTASEEDINKFNMVYGENGYLKTKLPYHVRDILIKVDASADDYSRGEISSDNATKLYNLLHALVKSDTSTNTYAEIAARLTDDTSSAVNYGEHLMDLDTSFINEFKLGLYTFDALYNEATKDNELKDEFQMPSDVEEDLKKVGVTYIPFEAVDLLYKYRNVTSYKDSTTGQDLTVNEGNAAYYPRNIIFNKYFNSHNISFITNNKVDSSDPSNSYKMSDTGVSVYSDLDDNGDYKMGSDAYLTDETEASHFEKIEGLEYPVLCDEKGNPIVVSRSETSNAGIHFVVIERSALEEVKDGVKLNEYYAPVNPLELNGQDSTGKPYYNSEFPTDSEGNQLKTYVNSTTKLTVEGYNSRIYGDSSNGITGIGEKLESYTSTNKDYQLFEWVTGGNFKAANTVVQEKVTQYITSQTFSLDLQNEQGLIDDWNEYDLTLQKQEETRKVSLIPETCAIHFGDKDYYGEGKLCYYTTSYDPKN